jgi:hypothetical protein
VSENLETLNIEKIDEADEYDDKFASFRNSVEKRNSSSSEKNSPSQNRVWFDSRENNHPERHVNENAD